MVQVLEVVHADGEQLLSYVEDASHVAEGISHTVKALDTTQSNVKAALDHIKLLTDRLRFRSHSISHCLLIGVQEFVCSASTREHGQRRIRIRC